MVTTLIGCSMKGSSSVNDDHRHGVAIRGIHFVSPSDEAEATSFMTIKQINAQWVSFSPYAIIREGDPEVFYNTARQWWGERPEGIGKLIRLAREEGLKIVLKPHIWLHGGFNTLDLSLSTEAEWQQFEKSYREYLLT